MMGAAFSAKALRLQKHVEAYAQADFAWGRFDCCTWAFDWVLGERGFDLMAGSRGLFTAKQAGRAIVARGGLHRVVCDGLGDPLATPLLAQMGDVLLVPTPRGSARAQRGLDGDALGFSVGVCMGDFVAAPAKKGLAFLPLAIRSAGAEKFTSCGVAAWRV